MLPRHIATRLVLIVLMVAPASACVFDCRFDATNPSPDPTVCRGPTPALVTTTYPTTTYLRLKVSAGSLSVQSVDPVAMFVDLSNRSITDVAAGGLSCYHFVPHAYLQGDQWFNGPVSTTPLLRGVILDNNALTSMPNLAEIGFGNGTLFTARNNTIASVDMPFTRFNDGACCLAVILEHNLVSSLTDTVFNSTGRQVMLSLDLNYNLITALPSAVFNSSEKFAYSLSDTFGFLDVDANALTSLPADLFNTSDNFAALWISATNNSIASVSDDLFRGHLGRYKIITIIKLNNNDLDAADLQSLFGSFRSSDGLLSIDLSENLVTAIPDYLFNDAGTNLSGTESPSIELILQSQRARLSTFSSKAFDAAPNGVVNVQSITLDLSNNPHVQMPNDLHWSQDPNGLVATSELTLLMRNTAQTNLSLEAFSMFARYQGNPDTDTTIKVDFSDNAIPNTALSYAVPFTVPDIGFQEPFTFPPGHKFDLTLQRINLTELLPNSFGGLHGSVDLSDNLLTRLNNETFNGSTIAEFNLSNNQITLIEPQAFVVSASLETLDLSHNQLTSYTTALTANTPLVRVLNVSHNALTAIPYSLSSNRLFDPSFTRGNPLQCTAYSPVLINCSCPAGQYFLAFCGYGLCTDTPTGCPNGSRFTNTCDNAPGATCLAQCGPGQFLGNDTLDAGLATCAAYTDCSTTFGAGVPGYEFGSPTATSDRICSACAICPEGFQVTPCTATSNTVCEKSARLSDGDIAAILASLLLVFLGGVGGTSYVFLRKKKKKTDQELELSQLLLSEVEEDNSRMRRAWEIEEKDLRMKRQLASGSFGEVWSAEWGHIDVAVKLLHAHLVELDTEKEEFNKEAVFLQSIKHPNLLLFYGCGVTSNGAPFLVVELMAFGSLRVLIRERQIEWPTRRQFAVEVAQGMAHLHGLGSMHRDLKSDNCLVDSHFHVKVGDFGNSRLRSTQLKPRQHKPSAKQPAVDGDFTKSLTVGVGTPLWMAPELLRRATREYGKEVDIYSFAIVQWELLTQQTPWAEELKAASELEFLRELEEALFAGRRPTVPRWCEAAEFASYVALMQQCWATEPDKRPAFNTVASLLANMAHSEGESAEATF
eukprot:m.468340 g.468340  ORF g.468340 m.468340 type:complete len:1105 (-) comp27396_c0_seq1:181-3495(-)